MSNSGYYGSGGGKYTSIPEEHEMFSPDPSSPPAHKRSDSQDTLVGGPFSPDMRGPGRRGFFSSSSDLEPGPRLQTRMASMSPREKKALSSLYSSRRQMRKNFLHMIARFAFTTACCAAIVGLFKFYGNSGVLDNDNKHVFNAIYIGISMILSMNLISAFKSLANMIRWRLLAAHEFTLREVDLILACSSFQKTIQLLFTPSKEHTHLATKSWVFRLGAIAWILLGVAAQVAIALIGLTYNHENDTALKMGPVNITALDSVYPETYWNFDTAIPLPVQKSAANMHGSSSYSMVYVYTPDTIGSASDMTHLLLFDPADNTMKYTIKEWAVDFSVSGQLTSDQTNRSVIVTPQCEYYPIEENKYGDADTPFTILTNEGVNVTIDWLKDSMPGQNIIVNPYWEGISPEYLYCGDRCSRLYIFEFPPWGGEGLFFNCTVEVSPVYNAVRPEHEMPDEVARIFAGSPGSQGWYDDSGRQMVRYNQASYWGVTDRAGEEGEKYVGEGLAWFVAGSIANYDQYGPMIASTGNQQWQGVRLIVKWRELYITLGMILAINLIFGIFIVIKANAVFCKDDSFLSIARLLRPMLERLGDSGSHLKGWEIADTYDKKVVYGYRVNPQIGIHHLDFGEDIPILASGKYESFPNGTYD